MRWTEIYPSRHNPTTAAARLSADKSSQDPHCEPWEWLSDRLTGEPTMRSRRNMRGVSAASRLAELLLKPPQPCLFNAANASLLPEFVALGLVYISPPTGRAVRLAETRFRSSATRNSWLPKNLFADVLRVATAILATAGNLPLLHFLQWPTGGVLAGQSDPHESADPQALNDGFTLFYQWLFYLTGFGEVSRLLTCIQK